MKTIKWLINLLSSGWGMVVVAALAGGMYAGSHLGLLMVSAYLLAKAALQPSIAELQVAIVGVRFFGLARGVFRYLERWWGHTLAFRLMTRMRTELYQHLAKQNNQIPELDVSSRRFSQFMHDVNHLENFLIRIVVPLLSALFIIPLVLLLMCWYDCGIAGIVALFFVVQGLLIPALINIYGKKMMEGEDREKEKLTRYFLEWLGTQPDIVLSGRAAEQYQNLIRQADNYSKFGKSSASLVPLHETLSLLTIHLCVALTALYCLPLIKSGQLEVLHFSVILIGVMAGFESLRPLPESARLRLQTKAAFKRLPVMESVRETKNEESLFRIETARMMKEPMIWQFSDVSFSYRPDYPMVFRDLSVVIGDVPKTAIVGPSGCGKSTLIRLMVGFFPADRGHIFLNQKNIREYKPESILNRVSVCGQNDYIFNGTVRENVLMGYPQATEKELEATIEETYSQEWIASLPKGLDTPVGQYGYHLSGGMRQRIALIRALLRPADVLILDEPTAHLDPEAAQHLFRLIRHLQRYAAIIVITHDTTGLDSVNQIVFLSGGTIVDTGGHSTLMQRCETYASWVEEQNAVI